MFRLIHQCPWGLMYVVQPGDTIRSISRKFRVYDGSLVHANPYTQGPNPNELYTGLILCIPTGKCPPNSFIYIVKQGDTIYKLAEKFGLDVQHILSVNPDLSPDILQIGQQICLPDATY
ncbi:LysM peptidoglycan-binding domain-containing protein [Brevibacillus laterosporus]|uniref:LysM peptidoglycan-binding domain-containing protein n=1 Tax=Brevibacillus laterosporus TaxID=1465 RepID=UPI00054F294F|nr:LysM domain-containing protein [Brevibacillus laterosporus]